MKCAQNAKNKKCVMGYFASLFSHFASFWDSCEMSKGFHCLFVCEHEIWMTYKECIVGVSYFVVCFINTLAKYLWNAKYDKYIAGFTNRCKNKSFRCSNSVISSYIHRIVCFFIRALTTRVCLQIRQNEGISTHKCDFSSWKKMKKSFIFWM